MREDRSRQPLNPPEQAASAFAVTSLGSQVNSAHSAFADVRLAHDSKRVAGYIEHDSNIEHQLHDGARGPV
jgi:hypothetical protein